MFTIRRAALAHLGTDGSTSRCGRRCGMMRLRTNSLISSWCVERTSFPVWYKLLSVDYVPPRKYVQSIRFASCGTSATRLWKSYLTGEKRRRCVCVGRCACGELVHPSPGDIVSLARVLVVAVLVFLRATNKRGGGGLTLGPGPNLVSCGC
jgi:hypothetical protein